MGDEMRLVRTVGVAAAAGALVGVAMTATGAAGPARAGSPASPAGLAHAGHRSSAPPTTAFCEQNYHLACYQAGQLQAAYGLPALYRAGVQGQGTAIAIVDSFGSPTIRQDLATFDRAAKLPSPSLTIIQPAGRVPAYRQANAQMVGWAAETTLDVEYAHAVAPRAGILLVETPVAESEGGGGFPQIARGANSVIHHHLAGVISQSFGATEQTFPGVKALQSLRSAYQNADLHHVTVVSASGDAGAADGGLDQSPSSLPRGPRWPPGAPRAPAVGGTQLHLTAAGRRTAPDTVWNDTYNRN